jgi:hypothetical protein
MEPEFIDEAKRLALLPVETQKQIIALHRETARDPRSRSQPGSLRVFTQMPFKNCCFQDGRVSVRDSLSFARLSPPLCCRPAR